MPTDITALERPQLAAQQLLAGDTAGAWDAMLQPQNLTARQQEEYLKRLGIKGSVYEAIFKSVTNPLLIASLVLSHAFPVASARDIFKMSEKVGGFASRIPVLGRWMSKDAWFRGTKVPGIIDDIAADMFGFKSKAGQEMALALQAYKDVTGKLPGAREQILVSSWVDGLHKPLRGWQGKDGVIRVGAGSTQATLPGIGVLMPELESKMSPELLQLARNTRQYLNNRWKEVFEDPQNRKAILKALRRQQGTELWDEDMQFIMDYMQNPRKIPDYFPHRILKTAEDFQRLVQMTTTGGSKKFAAAAQKKAAAWASDEVRKREFAMLPSWMDLNKVRDALDPAALERLESVVKAKVLHGARQAGVRESVIKKLNKLSYSDLANNYTKYLNTQEAAMLGGSLADFGPKQYSLRLVPVIQQYTHTLAGTYAWTVKGGGDRLLTERRELAGLAGMGNAYAKARLDVLDNTLIPMATGRQTFHRVVKSQLWQQGIYDLVAKLDQPFLRKVLGNENVLQLKEDILNSKGAFSLMGLQSKAAAYFYVSTLGLNPASALRNLFQNVLTLGPTLGWRTTAHALKNVMGQSHNYFALRMGPRGLSHEQAIAKVFPNFAEAGLAAGHITEEIVEQSLRSAANVALMPTKAATTAEKISRAMMSLFTASESVNRLASFEAGMIHAGRAGLKLDESISFAREIVRKTQFAMTPTSGPLMLANYGPVVKQFLYFPLRMLEFATSTAFTLGSGAINPVTGKEMNILGYNPGTAARMVAGSIIAMEAGDALGLDFRSALLGSALPTLRPVKEGSPFGALPVVPPAIGVAGSALYGATTGEWDALKHSLPLLIPGGIFTARVAGFVPPQVGGQMGQSIARVLDRTYADYHQPAPDGRVAVYSGQGTFRGYYSPWDLIKSGLGVKGGDLDKEQELLAMVTKNRDNITQSKRDYFDARYRNSAREANAIAVQFKQKFGFDLPISEADMKAMQTRRHVTRLEQLIRTTPAGPMRNQLISAVQASLGTSAQDLMGVDPALLGAPRPVAERSRFGGGKVSASSLPRFEAQSDLSPLDSVNPQKIGRQPGVTNLQPIP